MASITRWCPTCQEDCIDHSTVCTVCGTLLQSSASVRVVPPSLEREIHTASQDLIARLQSLRSQVRNLQAVADNNNDQLSRLLQQRQQQWQAVPAEAMDPQQAPSRSRPTAKAILDSLPRITLEDGSFLFHQATVMVDGREFAAILGEFGPTRTSACSPLIVANPLTGMGGLSNSTKMKGLIVYMERGDGFTFVQKALMAQAAGAVAVIIGNNIPEPWPYVMKDSKGESASLTIPVVMVKQSDGHVLFGLEGKECRLDILESKNECVVCRDHFETCQTVIQLPACGHTFHEKCALTWLTHHNACPYCRRELPTDDAEYEQERRRTQRTHAGSTTASSEWHDLYG
jgi:PA domain/Ring finger domain